jgi:uncharacterized membrane protein (UPF0127 family)
MRNVLPLCCVLLASCGGKPQNVEDFNTRDVTLPHGQVIKVETMISSADLRRGMMYRTSLAPDHGMLFVHPTPGNYSYWMYQTLIPLDIIWMDSQHRIVQMVLNAQPCKTESTKCTQYYCTKMAQYVLELSGGMAKKYGLELDQTVQF